MTDAASNPDGSIAEYDILIIGAGISGISAAYHVQTNLPGKSYRILEGRENMGGTWDLFKYPGIRCDSHMPSFGFSFRPWQKKEIIVGADEILDYLKDTVKEYDLEKQIEFQTRVQTADWDPSQAKWILQTTRKGSNVTYKAPYLFMCTGYYNYDKGYQPKFPNQEAFQGPIIHPQLWPEDLNYDDKKIVVIGSGATAVTLVPSLAKTAKHVTMLQRSPTYIVAGPATSTKLAQAILKYFGPFVARWYFISISMLFYWFCRTFPERAKKAFLKGAKDLIGEDKFDPKHFSPRYNPWDERLCLVPDGDFFATIQSGKADVVTDHIQEFTADGIRLRDSKEELKADIIVAATGLELLFAGGIQMSHNGTPIALNSKFAYKGFMLDNVPNLFLAAGYTNASWTLKVDLTNQAACRLVKATERRGAKYCQPEVKEGKMPSVPLLDLQSGYVQRNLNMMPKQSDHLPWKLNQNYIKDKFLLEYTPLDDTMAFY